MVSASNVSSQLNKVITTFFALALIGGKAGRGMISDSQATPMRSIGIMNYEF